MRISTPRITERAPRTWRRPIVSRPPRALLALVVLAAVAHALPPPAVAQDLTVPSLSLTGGLVSTPAGPTVTVNDTTRNDGAATVAPSATHFFLIPANTLDLGRAIFIGSRPVPELAPFAASAAQTVITLSTTLTGTFQVIAQANPNNTVAETNTGNNLSAPASRQLSIGPDLVVEIDLETTATGTVIEDRTRNRARADRGVNTSAGSSTTRFYVSTDAAFDAGDVQIGSRVIPALDSLASSTGQTPLVLPAGLAAGTYHVIAVADADNAIGENNDQNNAVAAVLVVASDLAVATVGVDRQPMAGASLTVTDTTTNLGVTRAPESTTSYFLSRDGALDPGDLFLGSRVVPALDPGVSSQGGTAVTIPATTATGCYFLLAVADAGQVAGENRETNNVRGRRVQVRPTTTPRFPCADRDFNDDRRSDILWRHDSGLVDIWFMDGPDIISAGTQYFIDTGWTIQGVGDFDGGGKADILWRHDSGLVDIWFMDGPTIVSTGIQHFIDAGWTIQGVGDFDADGKTDILWRHVSGLIDVWFMDGPNITGTGIQYFIDLGWTVQGVGDFDGDGQSDVLWVHDSGLVDIWFMDGPHIASAGAQNTVEPGWTIQGVGDFNSDGQSDILWRHDSGLVDIWFMDGPTIIRKGTQYFIDLGWTIQ